MRYVEQHRPTYAQLENVATILHQTGTKGDPAHAMTNCGWLTEQLAKLNYHLNVATLSSQHFLLPQRRRRVWMLAERNGSDCGWSAVLGNMAAASQTIPINVFIS